MRKSIEQHEVYRAESGGGEAGRKVRGLCFLVREWKVCARPMPFRRSQRLKPLRVAGVMSRLKPRPTNIKREADRGAERRISIPAGSKWSPHTYHDDFPNFLADVAWSARIVML